MAMRKKEEGRLQLGEGVLFRLLKKKRGTEAFERLTQKKKEDSTGGEKKSRIRKREKLSLSLTTKMEKRDFIQMP